MLAKLTKLDYKFCGLLFGQIFLWIIGKQYVFLSVVLQNYSLDICITGYETKLFELRSLI